MINRTLIVLGLITTMWLIALSTATYLSDMSSYLCLYPLLLVGLIFRTIEELAFEQDFADYLNKIN